MKRAELTRLAKRLAARVPETVAWRQMVVFPPLRPVLRGVLLDPSGDPRAFYANAFFQPLYVPSDVIALNLGWRLGGGAHVWRIDVIDDEIELARIIGGEVTPRLARLQSPMDVVMAARAFEADGYAREAIAYSLIRFGNVEEALTSLRRLTREFDRAIPWQRRAAEHAERLVALLLTDPGQTRRQLDEWESQTAQSLQLPRTN